MIRLHLFHILYRPLPGTRFARPVSFFLAAMIVINCLALSLETVAAIYAGHAEFFQMLEVVSTGIFAVEYALRVWTCVEEPRYAAPVTGRLRYIVSPLALLDLLAILAFFAPLDLRFLRIFRLSRLFRVLHLEVFNRSMQAIFEAVGRRRHLLYVSVAIMATAVYCTAVLLYAVEHAAQPDKFSSIPATLWWAVVTLTTIGYGDMAPITPLGKVLTSVIAIFGIGIFALPTAILTAAILDAGSSLSGRCPHCQGSMSDDGHAVLR
ncbi:MAG: ion transporter [Pseudomonadota bacterium]|nr:ion transporter [Pseudomonadota bacterium]